MKNVIQAICVGIPVGFLTFLMSYMAFSEIATDPQVNDGLMHAVEIAPIINLMAMC